MNEMPGGCSLQQPTLTGKQIQDVAVSPPNPNYNFFVIHDCQLTAFGFSTKHSMKKTNTK